MTTSVLTRFAGDVQAVSFRASGGTWIVGHAALYVRGICGILGQKLFVDHMGLRSTIRASVIYPESPQFVAEILGLAAALGVLPSDSQLVLDGIMEDEITLLLTSS